MSLYLRLVANSSRVQEIYDFKFKKKNFCQFTPTDNQGYRA